MQQQRDARLHQFSAPTRAWFEASFAGPTPAQEGAATDLRRYEVRRATSKIEVDGRLDEEAWASALVFDVPYEWQPGDNAEPPVKTDFLVTYDDENLYVCQWNAGKSYPIKLHRV